ncbi:efflux RND transporter periplasmic adaptor subunit [Chloroflexota bacterium]
MKKWKIIGTLLLGLIILAVTSCSGEGTPENNIQYAEVTRGDFTMTVSGSGSIEASREVNLSFSSGGKVAGILVEEGDQVSKGDKLAQLDSDALELARSQAQVSLHQSEVALTQAKLAEITAEYNLNTTRKNKDALDLALFQAQIDVASANYSLENTSDLYTWSDIKIAQANVDSAEEYLVYAIEKLGQYIPVADQYYYNSEPDTDGYKDWQERVVQAQRRLDTAEDALDAMLTGSDTKEVIIKKLQLQAADMAEEQARKDVNELNEDIALKESQLKSAKESTTQAERSVELAQQALAQAQKQLDEATIIAPFSGVIANVYAEESEFVTSASIVIRLVDVSVMELVVELDEIDIPGVKAGQSAIIEIDALPDDIFPGTIAYVNPIPIETGGIVLYNTKIDIKAPSKFTIMVGMSASADIIIEQRENALLIPSRAVYENEEKQKAVMVLVNEQAQERLVVTGIDDGIQTEIISGLSEGETVIFETKARASESISFF